MVERSASSGPRRAVLRLTVALAVPLAAALTSLAAPPAGAAATVSWIDWDPPVSYPSVTTDADPYGFATVAEGSIVMPDASTVYVRLTGEIVDPYLYPWATESSIYGRPSGFGDDGTAQADYWTGGLAYTVAANFTSAGVPSVPTSGDHIGLIGESTGAPRQTLEFFADAGRTTPVEVTNLVMLIYSLGRTDTDATWEFSQDVTVLSDNRGQVEGGFTATGLQKTVVDGTSFITGREGAGTLQLTGTFERLTFEVAAPERWAAWNIGVTSAAATSGSAAALSISTQPVGGVASGAVLPTQPVVRIVDAFGNTVTGDSTTTVAVAILSGDGGTILGTTTVTAVAGIATFTDLALSGDVGTDYVLRFSSTPSLTPVDATAVQVIDAPVPSPSSSTDTGATGPSPTAACRPAAVRVGDVVTCDVAGGPADAELLWRATAEDEIEAGPVRLDGAGAGTFRFTVPASALGRDLAVELVAWTPPQVLGIVTPAQPTVIRAGGGPSDGVHRSPGPLVLLAVVLGVVGRRMLPGPRRGASRHPVG